ncbi:MAG: signal recognition particle-docking protein FtsY [Clostridia bacterium]|nr:signal recognition particle-docking protein FtsY [Clostridia bacterium]
MAFLREKKNFFGRMSERIADAVLNRPTIDEDLFDELEEILITSDIGMDTTMHIMEQLREKVKKDYINNPALITGALAEIIASIIDKGDRQKLSDKRPLVILMIGINGGGKTTSIGKLAHKFKLAGDSVLLAAADTFRAAASDQLKIWGERNGVPVIAHQEGADPSAVIYDAIQSAKARGTDVLICDTAGRLQTQKNLMNELEKMNKIISREYPEAERETLLVLDATTGKNALSQAEEFSNIADISGIVLTKLDGTAKGGIAITVADEYDIPVKFIGFGEKIDDLKEFDAVEFAGGIFNE